MQLDKRRLDYAFTFSFLLTLFFPVIFPSVRMLFFAPVIIIAIYAKPFSVVLWFAIFCGFILDLLSANMRMGIQELLFMLSTIAIYPFRKQFFADSLSTLPLMTFLFSVAYTILSFIVLKPAPLSLSWLASDFILMPLMDASYSFIVFIVPYLLSGQKPKRGRDYIY